MPESDPRMNARRMATREFWAWEYNRHLKPQTTVLFRPVGQEELQLTRSSGFKEFPQRLAGQAIFYPVINEEYARQIAERWNAKRTASGRGYVTYFQVRKQFLDNYEVKTVGSSIHQEYWIPAADLVEFNRNIVGQIKVIAEFGDQASA